MNYHVKIILLYLVGLISLFGYWLISTSDRIEVFLKKASRVPEYGFTFHTAIQAIEFVLLVGGMGMIVGLTGIIVYNYLRKE